MVDFETIEQLAVLAHIFPVSMISQGEKCIGVCLTHGIRLRQFLQTLLGKLEDALQHGEADLPTGTLLLSQQTLLNERLYAVEKIDLEAAGGATDRLRGFEAAAARKHPQSCEEHLLQRIEEVVAPGDGGAQSLLPCGEIPRAAGEDGQPVVEP